MFESLFGSEMPLAARFFIAFLVVLALIGLTAWLVRRFGANRLGNATRGRQPRLAVIDAATVDGRRRLVLIRRDNIEHLLMIGGPTDVVVEPNIVRAVGAREAARVTPAAETSARTTSAFDNGWPPLQPVGEPASTTTRPSRSTTADESWMSPEPAGRGRQSDSLTGLAAELSTRLNPPDSSAPASRTGAGGRAAPPVNDADAAHADHNLAEMAHQLEAALRRAPAPEGRPPVTDPLAQPAATPAKGPDVAARIVPRELKARLEPKFDPKAEPKPEPKAEAKAEPKFDLKPERSEPPATPGKNLYENLEEEMASLLGRPPGKS